MLPQSFVICKIKENEWMKWMNEWMNEMNEMNEWMNEMNEWMNEMNEWMKWMNEWMKWMNEWLNETTLFFLNCYNSQEKHWHLITDMSALTNLGSKTVLFQITSWCLG